MTAAALQLAKQLDWSFEAVEIAQKGLKDLGTKMKDKLEEIQKKVREHMVAALISGIFTALFSITELFYNPMGEHKQRRLSPSHT